MIITEAPIYMVMFASGAMGHFISQVILSIKNNSLQHFITNDKGCCHELAYDKNSNFCYVETGDNHFESINKKIINLEYDIEVGLTKQMKRTLPRNIFKENFVISKKDKQDTFYITKRKLPWYLTLNHFHFSENEYYDSYKNTISQFPNLKLLVIKSYDSDIELLSLLKHKKDFSKKPYSMAFRAVKIDIGKQFAMLKYLDAKSIKYTTIKFRDIIDNPLLCYNIICDYLGESSTLQQDILHKWNDYLSANEKLYGKL